MMKSSDESVLALNYLIIITSQLRRLFLLILLGCMYTVKFVSDFFINRDFG